MEVLTWCLLKSLGGNNLKPVSVWNKEFEWIPSSLFTQRLCRIFQPLMMESD